MTEMYIWDIGVEDIPVNQVKGTTNKRRVQIYFTGTATAADTVNLATYVTGLTAIEGITYYSLNYAKSTGATTGTITWSSTTVTAGDTGTIQASFIGYMG